MMNRLLISPLLVAAVLITSTAAFSTQSLNTPQRTNAQLLQTPTILFAAEDEGSDEVDSTLGFDAPKPVAVKCPDCDLCDGSGRILGGIGVVLPWWPIKAYRPCPNFIDRGGIYERSGQGLDEIAFGRDSTFEKTDY